MLKFDWNALRDGDEVEVHVPWETGYGLTSGVVAIVDSKRGVNGIGIRVLIGDEDRVVWPPHLAVHRSAATAIRRECWRCDELSHARSA